MLTSSLAPVAFNLAGSTFNNSYVETPIGTTQFPNTTQITAEGNGSGMFGDIFCAYSINEKDPSYVRTSSEVFVYASSVFIVLGLIGNALSVMVNTSLELQYTLWHIQTDCALLLLLGFVTGQFYPYPSGIFKSYGWPCTGKATLKYVTK